MKLVQKQLFKGKRSFEIDGDTLRVTANSALRQEMSSLLLAVINPEPVSDGSRIEFRSRVNSETMFTLLPRTPDEASVNAFVALLQQRIREEYSAFTGLRSGQPPVGLAANSYEEPPDFDTPKPIHGERKTVSAASIDSSLRMLREHLDGDAPRGLFDALEALRAEPDNPARFTDLVNAFEDLGPRQGAVLTYAPYLGILLSDDPFDF